MTFQEKAIFHENDDHFPAAASHAATDNDKAALQEHDHFLTFQEEASFQENDHYAAAASTKEAAPRPKIFGCEQKIEKPVITDKLAAIFGKQTRKFVSRTFVIADPIPELTQKLYSNIHKQFFVRTEVKTDRDESSPIDPMYLFPQSSRTNHQARSLSNTPKFVARTFVHSKTIQKLKQKKRDVENQVRSLINNTINAESNEGTERSNVAASIDAMFNPDDFSEASMERDAIFVPQDEPSSGASPATNHRCNNHITNEMMKLCNGDFKNSKTICLGHHGDDSPSALLVYYLEEGVSLRSLMSTLGLF